MRRTFQELKQDEELRSYQSFQAAYEIIPIASRTTALGMREIHVHIRCRLTLRMRWMCAEYRCDDDVQAYALFSADRGVEVGQLARDFSLWDSFSYTDLSSFALENARLSEECISALQNDMRLSLRACDVSEECESEVPNSRGRGYIWGFSVEPRTEDSAWTTTVDPEPFHISCPYWDYYSLCRELEMEPDDVHMLRILIGSDRGSSALEEAVRRLRAKFSGFFPAQMQFPETENVPQKRSRS